MAGNQAIVDALYHATMVFFAMFFIAITIAFAVKIWRELEPGKRAEIKRRAPGIAARGILGALKWSLVAVVVFGVELVRFALKENPDPHNRKL